MSPRGDPERLSSEGARSRIRTQLSTFGIVNNTSSSGRNRVPNTDTKYLFFIYICWKFSPQSAGPGLVENYERNL